jgi:RNA-directed DNA polymerase
VKNTSFALANACSCWWIASWPGSQGRLVRYTRYADDLLGQQLPHEPPPAAFSGSEELERRIERFSTYAAAILMEEGFSVNFANPIHASGVRQYLAGLVVNRCANVMRPDLDRLKAILTNCLRLELRERSLERNRL